MTENQLLEIIHESLDATFSKNSKEFYEMSQALVDSLVSSDKANLSEDLFKYSAFVSELTCITAIRTLVSAGVLNVSSSDE